MPALRVAPFEFEPMVLRLQWNPRTALRRVRHELEHIFDMWPVSGLQPSVDMDVVPEMCRVVVARRLVRGRHDTPLTGIEQRIYLLGATSDDRKD
jgi:hypothetical protein